MTTPTACDCCQYPVGDIAPFTIDTTTRNCCRFCRHSLMYGRLGNITKLIERFFGEVAN